MYSLPKTKNNNMKSKNAKLLIYKLLIFSLIVNIMSLLLLNNIGLLTITTSETKIQDSARLQVQETDEV